MARVKSGEVRQAILDSAAKQIAMSSYMDTTVAKIAKGAGIVPSNVYIYFDSKLQIYLEIYGQWLQEQMEMLDSRVARARTPRTRVQRLVHGLLVDIVDDATGYTSALMEGLAVVQAKDHYSPDLLLWTEARIIQIISTSLDGYDSDDPRLRAAVHLLMLTFDGMAMRMKALRSFNQHDPVMPEVERAMVDLLLSCRWSGRAPSQKK
ncbi:TetR/AcrR family transcriptional regulator [Pseudomonas sessilinigenes]|uniref:TetR/AcrR family transcriptional regulator n=1 Tax=Pseudomonas sessilinigenes TaxID=658629 RepID=A0ABX8MXB7_9PSED|nr:TetR/AcrR family transcriptional regulator [Pseudomonas sessilinigenes]QXH43272.1 TetR/AcrR family transcriptional regulator [Pseudomonas sessilinigenes]